MKTLKKPPISAIIGGVTSLICLICLFLFPENIAQGVKNGFILLGENIIPSLFPFMILSTYIAKSPMVDGFCIVTNKISNILFGISGKGLLSVLLGFLGGYPIGAKTVADYYISHSISQKEATKLLCWCVNPGPAFVITAIGKFMLGNTFAGILIYICVILSSLTIGLLMKFTDKNDKNRSFQNVKTLQENDKNIFVNSVSSACTAMISICGWVLTFCAVSSGLDEIIKNNGGALFLKSVLEVTTGCRECVSNNLSLPIICAIISFGGFAVIFQVAPYLEKCGLSIKLFTCIRAVNSALSAFYCTVLLKIFPLAKDVYTAIYIGTEKVMLSHSIWASIILIITCIVLILEVDYSKKVC